MNARIKLGEFIRRRRKYLHMTQDQLATKIHVSKSAIAKWETDGGMPDRDNLYRLAEVLGVTVDNLHRIIENHNFEDVDFEVNITPDIISTLESYGYKVIRPGKEEEK